ncbi:MAG TPA: hypothetical protein VFY14_03995 [Streptomyces sp.]|nr:hypothetical protein [Streptomyces sp.]
MNHMRRWGVLYLLAVLFVASWVGQLVAMQPAIQQEGWSEFWSATTENWQSEFLQLLFQAGVVGAMAPVLFRKSIEDSRRIEAKLDKLLRQQEKPI